LVAGVLDPGFNQLCKEASDFKRKAFAASTKSTYKSQLNAFLRFCVYFGCQHLPADQLTLRAYLAFLARSLNPNSLAGYLNVVRILHVQAGYPNPLKENWDLNMIKRGIARELGRPPVQKLPITTDILKSLYSLIDLNVPADLAFWSACLVCLFGLLRKGTLLPKNMSETETCLLRGDVFNLRIDSFLLKIRHTKTIQYGQRVLCIPFVSCADERLCPVGCLIRHMAGSRLPKHLPLFSYLSKGNLKGVTHAGFVSRLKCLLCEVGLNANEYSGHSFRHGGCSLCYLAGLSITDIKLRGDW
jgi:hypothetical protein